MTLSQYQFQRFLKKNNISESRVKGFIAKIPEEKKDKKPKRSTKKKTGVNDRKLWKVFSIYIRLRDADNNGVCTCITCGTPKMWNDGDCGHGFSRGLMATKYHEQNNHFQCRKCNRFKEGLKDKYKEAVIKRYGPKAWDSLEILSRTNKNYSQFEIDELEKYYKAKVVELKLVKKTA